MAVIQDRYGGAERGIGGSSAVDTLAGWFDYRRRANEAARAEGGEDPEKLAEMELEARKGLGELQATMARVKSADKKSVNDVFQTMMRGKTQLAVTSAQTSADVQDKKMDFQLGMAKLADAQAKAMEAQAAYSEKAQEIIDNIARDVKGDSGAYAGLSAEQIADKVVPQVEAMMQDEKAGGFGDIKHDNIARNVYNALLSTRKDDATQAVMRRLMPGMEESDTNAFYMKYHSPLSQEEAAKLAEKQIRKYGGGVNPNLVDQWAKDWGVDPSTIGTDTETSTETTEPGEASTGEPGVGFRGTMGSPGDRAAWETYRKGGDPYAAIEAGIAAQEAYADDLAARRKAAIDARAKGRGPHASDYLVNPNWYIGDKQAAAVRRAGEMDPGLAREFADAAIQNRGNVEAAKRQMEREGVDQIREFGAREYEPQNVATGGDLSGSLTELLTEHPPDAPIEGNGGWSYTVDPKTLVITVVGAPSGHKPGAKFQPGSDTWNAAMREIGPKHPVLNALATLEAQPPEVRALYVNVEKALNDGDVDHAKDLLRLVRPEYVRDAYGRAMQEAEDVPARHLDIQRGIAALPKSARGEWADAFDRNLDDYAATAYRGGYQASGASARSTGNLGRALVAGQDVAERQAALEGKRTKGEAAFAEAPAEYQRGKDTARSMLDEAKSDEERQNQVTMWREAHKSNPSSFTSGALDTALLTTSPVGKPSTVEGPEIVIQPGRKMGETATVKGADLSREPGGVSVEAAPTDDEFSDDEVNALVSKKKPTPDDEFDDAAVDALVKEKTK